MLGGAVRRAVRVVGSQSRVQQALNVTQKRTFVNPVKFVLDSLPTSRRPDKFVDWQSYGLYEANHYRGGDVCFTRDGSKHIEVHVWEQNATDFRDTYDLDVGMDQPTLVVFREDVGSAPASQEIYQFLAQHGWRVVVPQLFGIGKSPEEMRALSAQMSVEQVAETMEAVCRYARDKSSTKNGFEAAVGVVSVGSRGLALSAAGEFNNTIVHSAVGFGDRLPENFDASKLLVPVQLHFGKNEAMSAEQVDSLEQTMIDHDSDYEIWRYNEPTTTNFLQIGPMSECTLSHPSQFQVLNRMREFYIRTLNDSYQHSFTNPLDEPHGHIYVPEVEYDGKMIEHFRKDGGKEIAFGVRENKEPVPGLIGGNLSKPTITPSTADQSELPELPLAKPYFPL